MNEQRPSLELSRELASREEDRDLNQQPSQEIKGESHSLVTDKSEQEEEVTKTCLGPSTHLQTVEKSSMSEEQGPQQQQPHILTSTSSLYPIKDVQLIEQQPLERSDHSQPSTNQRETEGQGYSSSQNGQQDAEQLNQNRLQQYQETGEQQPEVPLENKEYTQEENAALPQVRHETAAEKPQQEDQPCHRKVDEVLQEGDTQKQEHLEVLPVETSGIENQTISTGHPDDLHSGVTHLEKQGQHEGLPIQRTEQEKQTVVQDHPGAREREAKTLVIDVQEKRKHDQGKGKEQPNQQTQQKEPNKNPGDKNQVKQKQEQQPKKQKTGFVGENYQRINYLVQASRALVTMGESDSDSESSSLDFDRPLASQTGSLATAVGRRCLIRLTPSLKRMLCKGCGTALIFGVNARVRHRSNRQKHTVITCLTCNTLKRFVSDPEHKLWCNQEEALI